MHYCLLGKSTLNVSRVGFGCWAIGGHKWGPIDDKNSIKAIHTALDLGVNFFDTADVYGFGHSEEILGQALASCSNKSRSVIVATKVGLRWNRKGKIFRDLSYNYVKQACEASLKRLKVDVIDLYQLHWPDPQTSLTETIQALAELVSEGKVRYVGVSNFPVAELMELNKYPWFVSYQGLLNLFNQEAQEEVLPFCLEHNWGFIAYEPLSKGLLTGKFNEPPVFPQGDHRRFEARFTTMFSHYQEKIKKLQQIAAANQLTLAQLALALLLIYKGVTTVIPGIKTADQVKENALAANLVDTPLLGQLYEEVQPLISLTRLV